MSTVAIINKFDGGHAEDLRTHNTDECEYSKNFDVFSNPHKLIPYADSIAETTGTYTMDDVEISDIDYVLLSGSYVLRGIGYETDVSIKPTWWSKSTIISTFVSDAVAAGNAYQKGSACVYKDLYYALAYNGSGQFTLYRYNSAGSVTSIGTISTSGAYARMFVHPQDNILYIVINTTISRYDGTTLTTYTSILPAGMSPVSITDYGTYLAIAMTPNRGNGNSIVYLWGRDGTINTLQGEADFGEGNITMLENLGNVLIGIISPQNNLSTITGRVRIKGYSGGAVETLKTLPSMFGIYSFVAGVYTRVKNGNKLYFASSNDDCVYAFGKNNEGSWILTKDRYLLNGTTVGSIVSLAIIGDIMWRGFYTIGGAYTFMRSKINSLGESFTYSAVSAYQTTINQGMGLSRYTLQDKHKKKQLEAVLLKYTGIGTTGTIGLQYSVDGGSWTDIISQANVAGEISIEALNELDGQPLKDGREFQFRILSSGGSQINELDYKYNVLETTI